MKRLTLVFALLFMLVLSCNISFAGDQDFTLVNKTGVTIKKLYVAPSKSNDWEENILAKDVLLDGETFDIAFSGQKSTWWDIRVEDNKGNYSEWEHFNLKEVSKVTLKKDGQAEYE